MQILFDIQFQYICNHNKFDTYCHVMDFLSHYPVTYDNK